MDEPTGAADTADRIKVIRTKLARWQPQAEVSDVMFALGDVATLLAAYDHAARERDSLARRLATRYEELTEARTGRDWLAAALQELAAIHVQSVEEPGWCDGCPGRTWPCRSRAILDGVLPLLAREGVAP